MNWLQKLARPQYGFLGEESIAFRTVDISRAEEVLGIGFKTSQFFATSEERAVFYANFTSEPCPGVIFECLVDSSRSQMDINDTSPEQSEESSHGIQSAASEVYEHLRSAGIDNIEIYDVERFIGSQAASELGYYDTQEEASLWMMISKATDMSPSEVAQIVPSGIYGGFVTLDNRGVFGINTDNPSEQFQHFYAVPPENIKAAYLHTSILSNLGWGWETHPSGIPVDGMGDYLTVIPAQMEELYQAVQEQLSSAIPDSDLEGYLYDLSQDFEENMSSYEDMHGSVQLSGIIYRKLMAKERGRSF